MGCNVQAFMKFYLETSCLFIADFDYNDMDSEEDDVGDAEEGKRFSF